MTKVLPGGPREKIRIIQILKETTKGGYEKDKKKDRRGWEGGKTGKKTERLWCE